MPWSSTAPLCTGWPCAACKSVPDAEDVYQDVFLRLLDQDAGGWDGERLKAWLLRTTVNRCADLHRFRLRRPTVALSELTAAPAPSETGFDAALGNYLVLDHGGGLTTVYACCRSVDVKQGDTVRVGEMIAAVGSTGQSTGPHLHFEVRQDGEAQNPVAYFDSAVRDTLRAE